MLIETGPPGGGARVLPSARWSITSADSLCLGFEAAKVRAGQLIPLSAEAAAAIRAQAGGALSARWRVYPFG